MDNRFLLPFVTALVAVAYGMTSFHEVSQSAIKAPYIFESVFLHCATALICHSFAIHLPFICPTLL